MLFLNPDGAAERALRQHRGDGVLVNSREYEDALSWAKRTLFAAKDSARRSERKAKRIDSQSLDSARKYVSKMEPSLGGSGGQAGSSRR